MPDVVSLRCQPNTGSPQSGKGYRMKYFVKYYDKDMEIAEGNGLMSDVFTVEYIAKLLTIEKEVVTILEMTLLPNEEE